MSYATEVAADSPLYWWTLNETSGNSPNSGSAGTCAMVPTSATQNVTGYGSLGKCWQFNGSSGYASTSTTLSGVSGLATITVEMWGSIDAYANGDKLLCEYSTNAGSNDAFYLDWDSSSTAFDIAQHQASTANYWIDKFTRPSAAAFHHFVAVLTRAGGSSTNALYIDGSSVSPTTVEHDTLLTNFGNYTLYLMSRAGSGLFSAGKAQQVAIYSGALSSGRVTAHFNAAAAATPPVADFTGTPLSGSSPLSVAFTDTSTNEGGSPTFHWEKNDGSGWVDFAGSPTAQNPTETFS